MEHSAPTYVIPKTAMCVGYSPKLGTTCSVNPGSVKPCLMHSDPNKDSKTGSMPHGPAGGTYCLWEAAGEERVGREGPQTHIPSFLPLRELSTPSVLPLGTHQLSVDLRHTLVRFGGPFFLVLPFGDPFLVIKAPYFIRVQGV